MKKMLVVLVAVGCANESVETVSQPIGSGPNGGIVMNGIVMNAIVMNAITTNVVASREIVKTAMSSYGLASNATLRTALEDPTTRIFMDYLVSCALPTGRTVKWESKRTGQVAAFKGGLGLCPAWEKGYVDTTCRERVSACILARNNSFGYSVQISMRGKQDDTYAIALADHAPVHDHIAGTNNLVESTRACTTSTLDANRDCGWTVASVGQCAPGETVSIATGSYAKCDTGTPLLGQPGVQDNMLRVCEGTHACDNAAAIQSVNDACNTTAPAIDFACPASGYYAVMVGENDSDLRPDGEVGSTPIADQSLCHIAACMDDQACCGSWSSSCEKSCTYPASEKNVFRWREGSFYGDLFAEIAATKPQLRVNPETLHLESWNGQMWVDDNGALSANFVGVVYPQMHSCSSSNWREPEAYELYRVCAGPDPKLPGNSKNCAAKWEGPCAQQCATLDAPPVDRDFDAAGCRDAAGRAYKQPMTTFINAPCDIVPFAPVCATVQPTPILPW